MQKATLTKTREDSTTKNYRGDKELINSICAVIPYMGTMRSQKIVRADFYMSRSSSASVVYCTVWINGNGYHVSGSGRAGGHGYHKESAALNDALFNCGIDLYEDITGRGDAAMKDAIEAVVIALGFENDALIVKA